MAEMWVPKEEGLRQIIELLKESQSSDTLVQRHVQQVEMWEDNIVLAAVTLV